MKNKLIELLRKLLLPEGAIILTRAEVEALNRYEEKRKETADVAPVVRCKDCKYRDELCMCCHPRHEGILPLAYPLDFCSYGERREE